MTQTDYPPQHVAIIMDGNGRWAKKRGLPRLVGHNAGGNNIRPVVKIFADYGVKYLTLYMFSTENWNRPRIEVAGLLSLLAKKINQETQAFHQENIRLVHLGRQDRLSKRLREKVPNSPKIIPGLHFASPSIMVGGMKLSRRPNVSLILASLLTI